LGSKMPEPYKRNVTKVDYIKFAIAATILLAIYFGWQIALLLFIEIPALYI